jgi:hypothetical protein
MQGGISAGDVIDIRAFGFASFNAVMAATTDVSGGARIQLDADDSVFVQNMSKAQFDSNDFVIA